MMTTPVVTETRPQRESDPPPAATPGGWPIRPSAARIVRELSATWKPIGGDAPRAACPSPTMRAGTARIFDDDEPEERILNFGRGNRSRRLHVQTSAGMSTNPLTVRKVLAG
jgi:hypothetical protein